MRRAPAIFVAYLLLSVAYTWPLVPNLGSRLPSDPADPVFNTSILWWNATTVPFSKAWWNAPHYYPTEDVSAFTENLAGISLISSPVYWLTGNPVAAYNVAYLLTWPLSAFAVFLLVNFLTRQHGAAFLAGLAYAFTPYRTTEIAHIQSLSSYYLPLALLGLHGFLWARPNMSWEPASAGSGPPEGGPHISGLRTDERRLMWLLLFAAAWLLQSLANGYYMFYGAVVIALWLVYFCSTTTTWRAGATIVAMWALASLPLIPIMYKYSVVHERLGLIRNINEIVAFSATPRSWAEVSGDVWLWRSLLTQGNDDLFPGITAVAVAVIAAVILLVRRSPHRPISQRSSTAVLRIALALVTIVSVMLVVVTLAIGPWSTIVAGVAVRMKDANRAIAVAIGCGLSLILLTPRTRQALERRSPFVFYATAACVIALLCCGPIFRVGETIVFRQAPYAWLTAIRGFNELRVPTRFWMFGVLCLSVAAGLGYAQVRPHGKVIAMTVFSVIAAGLLVDGWMPTMRLATPPVMWTDLEPANRAEPILELPLGPDWDWDAVFRATGHRRRVVNGVSGYDPPHYNALRVGLDQRDPEMLVALASLGPIDIVVNHAADADGAWERYAASAPGAVHVTSSSAGALYRVPRSPSEPPLGETVPIVRVEGFRHDDLFANVSHDTPEVNDGKVETGWEDYPQQPGQWMVIDLGGIHRVGGLTHAIGDRFLDFPRELAIEVSEDESNWERVWDGPTAAPAFLSLVREPRGGEMRFAFPARSARYLRLLQLDHAQTSWHVSELRVHAPIEP